MKSAQMELNHASSRKSASWANFLAQCIQLATIILCVIAIFGYSIDLYQHGKQQHLIGWFSSAGFVMLTIPISIRLIVLHLTHWNAPNIQKYVVRIIWMIPLYAVESWLALRFKSLALYIETLRECYEAYVIFSFLYFLLALLGEEQHIVATLKEKPAEYGTHRFPANLVFSPWIMGPDFLFKCKLGVLQYVVVKNFIAVLVFIMESWHVYGEGRFRFTGGYLYTCIISNASQLWALYSLILFYFATKEELSPWRPVGKFLCVKMVVFFTWWQAITVNIVMSATDLISSDGYWTGKEISKGLQDYLICIEMFIASLAFTYAFTYKDFLSPKQKDEVEVENSRPFLSAFFQSSIPDEFMTDLRHVWYGQILPMIYPDGASPSPNNSVTSTSDQSSSPRSNHSNNKQGSLGLNITVSLSRSHSAGNSRLKIDSSSSAGQQIVGDLESAAVASASAGSGSAGAGGNASRYAAGAGLQRSKSACRKARKSDRSSRGVVSIAGGLESGALTSGNNTHMNSTLRHHEHGSDDESEDNLDTVGVFSTRDTIAGEGTGSADSAELAEDVLDLEASTGSEMLDSESADSDDTEDLEKELIADSFLGSDAPLLFPDERDESHNNSRGARPYRHRSSRQQMKNTSQNQQQQNHRQTADASSSGDLANAVVTLARVGFVSGANAFFSSIGNTLGRSSSVDPAVRRFNNGLNGDNVDDCSVETGLLQEDDHIEQQHSSALGMGMGMGSGTGSVNSSGNSSSSSSNSGSRSGNVFQQPSSGDGTGRAGQGSAESGTLKTTVGSSPILMGKKTTAAVLSTSTGPMSQLVTSGSGASAGGGSGISSGGGSVHTASPTTNIVNSGMKLPPPNKASSGSAWNARGNSWW